MPLSLHRILVSLRAPAVLTLLVCIHLVSLNGICVGDAGSIQSTADVAEPHFETEDFTVAIGIENTIRLGKWVPITVTPKHSQKITLVNVQARDGADVPVTYETKFDSPSAGPVQAFARFGRKSEAFQLTVFTDDDSETEFLVPLASTQILLSVQPLILTIESGQQIAQAINGASNRPSSSSDDNREIAKQITDLAGLPDSWLAYDAVDTIFLTTNDTQLLSKLSEKQLSALEGWVRHGGKLIISASPQNSPDWFAPEKPLARFAPGDIQSSGQFKNSSRLENFAQSRKQLLKVDDEPIETVVIEPGLAKVWVFDENRNALIVQHALGLGNIVFVAFDLERPEIVAWPSYSELIGVLNNGGVKGESKQSISTLGGGLTSFGFTDIIGQLFAPMEQFSKVQFVPFTAIAILIGLYILCIGPLDYFLLRKVFGRMELTWITFPLFSLLFCGLAVGISFWSRPPALQANQLEIIDIDATDSSCRGFVWTNFYSPTGDKLDLQLPATNSLDLQVTEGMTSWHGQPGKGLGGMNGGSTETATVAGYTQSIGLAPMSSELRSFPIPVSSSRAVFTSWKAETRLQIRSNLTFRERTDEIVGSFKNPLNHELVNCRLYHGNWAYVLDGPLAEDEVVDIATETSSKRIQTILNRKQIDEEDQNRTYATRWKLSEMNVGRIAEMMMFYEIAGGSNYTGLSHEYQGRTDMSELLTSQRVILVGELKGQVSQLDVTSSDPDESPPEYDQVTTFVRIVLPVNIARERSRR